MSGSLGVLSIGISWAVIGIVLSIVMGRLGHNSFGWLVLGGILGPLAVVLAVNARRKDERLEADAVQLGGVPGWGAVDVLVGFDGSSESVAAADSVVVLLGNRLGRLTAATVVAYGAGDADETRAAEGLRRFAARTPERRWGLEVLHGHPAQALGEYAATERYDVIAVGTRGAGITKAIVGSAASQLARHSTVPVLLAGANVGKPREGQPMSAGSRGAAPAS